MELKKRIKDDTVVSAEYLSTGLRLRITRTGDHYRNAVADLKLEGGELVLAVFKDTLDRYGIKVVEDNISPEEW